MSRTKPLRIAFIQPIVDPVREAWFREMASTDVPFRVFALRRTLAHRPGWESREDAGFDVEFVRSAKIRGLPFTYSGRWGRRGIRLIPLDLVWRLWRFKPAVIVATNATELLQAMVVRTLCSAKVALSAEDTRLTFSRAGRLPRACKAFLMRRADVLCAHSSAAHALLLELGIPDARIVRTPWAVDNEKFTRQASGTDVDAVRRRLDMHGVVFVVVAALIAQKGIDRLLAAWALMPLGQRSRASLLLVGDGPERQRLERLVNDQGLTEVRFAGHLDHAEVAQCLGAADAFVLPTLQDTWGLVVNEAMAASLPILCSKYAGSAEDLVQEGINGHVFDPSDAAQLARLMGELIDRPEVLARMGKRSKEIVDRFTISRSVASLLDALHDVAAKGRLK